MGFKFNPVLWFVCKSCRQSFGSSSELIEHKLENHLGDCLKTKIIVFEEKTVDPQADIDTMKDAFNKETKQCLRNPYVPLTQLTPEQIVSHSQKQRSKRRRKRRRSKATSPMPSRQKIIKMEPNQTPEKSSMGKVNVKLEVLASNSETSDSLNNSQVLEDEEFIVASVGRSPKCGSEKIQLVLTSAQKLEHQEAIIRSKRLVVQLNRISNIIDTRSIKTENISNDFPCEVCPASFPNKSQLSIHKSRHSTDQSFNCPHCPAALKTKRRLQSHLVISHGEGIVFECSFCDRPLTSKRALENHERTHTGDRPFKCPVTRCSKAFASSTGLYSHTRRLHIEELGLEQFECVTCGKNFGLRSSLKQHMRTHTS